MKLSHLTLPALAILGSCSAAPMRMEVRSNSSRLVPEALDPVELDAPRGVWEGAEFSEEELEAEAAALSAPREASYSAGASAAAAPTASRSEDAAGPSAEDLAKANNPLADMRALNFQNYYVPEISGAPNRTANTLWARYVQPIDRWLLRASLPLNRTPTGATTSESGLGDFNVFAAYVLSEPTSPVTYGVGPLLVIPTASDDALGSGRWQAGAAAVYFNAASPEIQFGGLVTYQTDFAGDSSRSGTSLMAVQPFCFYQLGGGRYVRSAPIMAFDLENGNYNVPIGVGIGKVIKMSGGNVLNLFVEPQFTVLEDGPGQPEFQLFFGLNTQFK
ncbi:MAG: hypothetical protein KDC14_02260 [Planctomycetes bacterium]|nr:hypothetical protein [Planctomycetota bacterium]